MGEGEGGETGRKRAELSAVAGVCVCVCVFRVCCSLLAEGSALPLLLLIACCCC